MEGLPDDVSAVVYVAESRRGQTLYGGSAKRRTGRALRGRLREHLMDPAKASRWDHLYFFPLRDETPMADVRHVESLIALDLRPLDSDHHPKSWRR